MIAKSLAVLEYDKIRRRLADHAAFSGGRELALRLEPSSDVAEVRRRLAMTAQARDFVDRRGALPLGGAHDMRPEIEGALRGRTLLPQELLDIRDSLHAAHLVKKALDRESARCPDLAALAECIESCPALYDAVREALDDEGRVLDDASPALRRLRRDLRTVHDRLVRQLESMVGRSDVREHLQEALITQRDGRFVIPVRSESRSKVPGVVHDTSDSGATVFVEPLSLVEHGNELRQLMVDEEREVTRILRELSGDVGAEADSLRDTIGVLADLDLAFACADYGYSLHAVTPAVLDDGGPQAVFPQARHPLLDATIVVPVDLRIGQDFRQLLITGPNTGGKTVVLKTLGLLTLMAQSGLQLPAADGALLSVFDAVYADIGDEQSIEQSLSTFSGHMTNIIAILRSATERSLVLLDELGAGTDPVEGEALAEALLEQLARRRITTVASTHYSGLKAYAHVTEGLANASVEFDPESLQPTYELTIGLPGRSNALAIASRLGLPDVVVDSARSRMSADEIAVDDLLAEIREARLAAVADRKAAAEARRQADDWAAQLEAALTELRAERAEIINDARQQAADELATVREAAQKLRRRAERDWAAGRAGERADQAREDLGAVVADLDALTGAIEVEPRGVVGAPDLQSVHPGLRVEMTRFGQTGEVIRVQGEDVEVQMGRMRVTVPVSEIVALPPKTVESSGTQLHRAAGAAPTASVELDLRGLRVDEGLERLDAYLDDAVLDGLPFVRIIHGHGTGAMKAAVRDALQHHPHVTRSRRGEQGEGGDGVTVAYLE